MIVVIKNNQDEAQINNLTADKSLGLSIHMSRAKTRR